MFARACSVSLSSNVVSTGSVSSCRLVRDACSPEPLWTPTLLSFKNWTVSSVFLISGILSFRPVIRRCKLTSMNWYFLCPSMVITTSLCRGALLAEQVAQDRSSGRRLTISFLGSFAGSVRHHRGMRRSPRPCRRRGRRESPADCWASHLSRCNSWSAGIQEEVRYHLRCIPCLGFLPLARHLVVMVLSEARGRD